jgi:hypothetical protein
MTSINTLVYNHLFHVPVLEALVQPLQYIGISKASLWRSPYFFGGTFKAQLAEICDSYFTNLMKKAQIRLVLLPVFVSDQQFSKSTCVMPETCKGRQESPLNGNKLIIFRRNDLDSDRFFFRAKIEGIAGYIRQSSGTSNASEAMLKAQAGHPH